MSEAKTGFTRGFFGCFGVLAAIVFVIIAFAALSHCAAVIPANDEQADTSEKDFNRLTYASHCANALAEAGGKGQINADRSAVVVPWSIVKVGGTDTLPVLECAVTEGNRVRFVTVEVTCEDDSAERCSALQGVSDARTVR